MFTEVHTATTADLWVSDTKAAFHGCHFTCEVYLHIYCVLCMQVVILLQAPSFPYAKQYVQSKAMVELNGMDASFQFWSNLLTVVGVSSVNVVPAF